MRAVADPKRYREVLLALLDGKLSDARWTAVVGLLAQGPAPGLAARLLDEFEVTLPVYVVDVGMVAGGRASMSRRGHGRFALPEAFPPTKLRRHWRHKRGGVW